MRCCKLICILTLFIACIAVTATLAQDDSDSGTPAEGAAPTQGDATDELHKRLQTALDEYNAAVEKEIEALTTAIETLLEKATQSGDLALAKKAQETLKQFRDTGTLPADAFMRPAREKGQRNIIRAAKTLLAKYEAVAKDVLKTGNVDGAQAVISESAEIANQVQMWQPRKMGAAIQSSLAIAGREAFRKKDLPPLATATNSLGMTLVHIPPGQFVMGEPGTPSSHVVNITRPFRIGQTEISQQQWTAVMKSMPWNNKKWTTASPENAATLISWDDAVAFCKTLTLAERRFGWLDQSQEYTLPTEAEWEYACRAGTTTRFSCGDDRNVLKEFAWFEATTGAIWSAETEIKRSQVDFYEPYAHPVGRKNANPWGLYDMHGNVSEWCSDWFGDLAATEATDPQGPATGTAKGFRGGSWLDDASTCTSSHRDHLLTRRPNEASFSVGFRVVLRSAQQAAGR